MTNTKNGGYNGGYNGGSNGTSSSILDTETPFTWDNPRYETYDPLPAPSQPDPSPEQSLWRAVVMQHLQDSIARHPRCDADFIRAEARRFFKDESSLGFVCDLAGWQPKMVLAMFTRCVQSGTVPRLVKQFVGTATHKSKPRGDVVG